MRFQSKTPIILIIATFAMSAKADGTASAILAGLYYTYIVPIFLAVPVILIIKTDNSIKKTPWVLVAIIIDIFLFFSPIWIHQYIFEYDYIGFIPTLLQISPAYLYLLAFWITDAKKTA